MSGAWTFGGRSKLYSLSNPGVFSLIVSQPKMSNLYSPGPGNYDGNGNKVKKTSPQWT